MADDKLKQELLYMASVTSKYDFSKMEVVESILRLENERKILDSVFGRRFKTRIFDIAAGVAIDDLCVLCGQPAENHVICNHCMETILGSDYAKNKIKTKQKFKFKAPDFKAIFTTIKNIKPISLKVFKRSEEKVQDEVKPALSYKRIIQYAAIICLILILCVQVWLLYLWHSIPTLNPIVEPKVSTMDQTPVSNKDAALEQLKLDFPEDEGYTITYAREDVDFVGRFLLERGQCCEEVEEQLTDEERYDYFFSEPVFIFYISNIDETSARVGMAEVNQAGGILVMGSFNDGRRTDCFYKYR